MRETNPADLAKFEERAKKPFGMADKIGYAAGDFANDLTFIIAAMFMLKFYTDIMGVSPAIGGIAMMASKVVDAFTDVAMGQIVDRSPYTARGKFAPWIRRFAGPVAVASLLIFAPYFAGMPMGFKVFWMFFTYLLWGSVCYTGVNIPYGSMASAMSNDPNERQQLSAWRNIGATIAQLIIVAVLPLIVYVKDANGNSVLSSSRMMLGSAICSVLAVILYMVCYNLTTERIKIENNKEDQKNVGQLFGILFTNRAFIGIIVSALILLLVQLTMSGLGNYIYPNYFNSAKMLSVSGTVNSLMVLVLAAVVNKLAARFGKKEIASAGAIFSAVMLFIIFTVHTHNAVFYLVLSALAYIGLSMFNLVCWAMIIDVIDDIEVKNHVRSDGTVYSVYSFARKLGQAAASGLTGALLTVAGYTQATAFDPTVTNKLYDMAALIPAIGFLLMACSLIFIYPLTKSRTIRNADVLKERRAHEEM